MEEKIIEIKKLNKIIKGNVILDNINLVLNRGKVYGFRGKNGSGKTMLFRAISGLIRPSSGEIVIEGKIVGVDESFPSNLGVLIENPGFLDWYTGYNNLKYLAEIKGKISEVDIKNAMEKVGLNPDDKRKYKKYSLGMKQRLGIAQAIMESPEILILDEPTNALDTEGIKLLNNIIEEFRENKKIVLVANHDIEELELISDEIFYIDMGAVANHKIVKVGE